MSPLCKHRTVAYLIRPLDAPTLTRPEQIANCRHILAGPISGIFASAAFLAYGVIGADCVGETEPLLQWEDLSLIALPSWL